jgi:hypothetical protein
MTHYCDAVSAQVSSSIECLPQAPNVK